ncbi:MAG TPA: hypothetical protein DF966_08170 [Sulfitobacter sp.]|nr:hypothetical protein [Sulfitobacter sp.]
MELWGEVSKPHPYSSNHCVQFSDPQDLQMNAQSRPRACVVLLRDSVQDPHRTRFTCVSR